MVSHKKIGAQAANVPQEVPVATESRAVTMKPTKAIVLQLSPRESVIFTIEAPTPVDINVLNYNILEITSK